MSITLAPAGQRAVAHWRQICRSHIRTPHIKRADIGGGGDSVPFEQALSNLAHAYLKDRAPQLLDHELGFQLLEKNEDNDRAVGIFGFKVGPQLLYAPVFFLNGELKGHELLYLKESDTFVPMKENWINYVLNRKPNIIGDGVTTQLNRLGVQRPSMDPFRLSPSRTHKYGSAQPAWLQDALPGLMDALGNPTRPALQVPGLLKSSAAMASRFLQFVDNYPTLAKPIIACYGPDLIKEAIEVAKTASTAFPTEVTRIRKQFITGSVFKEKSAAQVRHEADPVTRGMLKIWVYDGTERCRKGLTEKQAEVLKRDGIYIDDDREDSSKVYRVSKDMTLQNPDETGLYEVLCKPDSFEKCMYIKAPHGPRGAKTSGIVVKIDGDTKNWTETHPGDIFAAEQYSSKEYGEWFNKLPVADSLEKGSMYVLLTPIGRGTAVFEVGKSLPSVGDEQCYEVHWRNAYGYRRPDHLPPVAPTRYDNGSENDGPDQIVLKKIKGGRIVNRLNAIYLPEGTRAFKLKGTAKDGDPICCGGGYPGGSDSSDIPALRLGNHVDMQLGILKTSAELKVFNNGSEATVDGNRLTTRGALISLVQNYGLRETAAREVLKEAQLKHGIRCRIKFAQPYDSPYGELGSAPSAPPFPAEERGTDTVMGSGLPTYYEQEQEIPVEPLRPRQARPNYADPPDPMMSQQIQDAASTGQKEILDTSLLSNLLKGSQNETLIDKHLPNLMKGLDSLGRLLFNLYWHHDKFEDRYGGKDLPELEDSMRNAFENLGDVTLELKQKTIQPFPDEGVDVQFGANR